jgi:hypothetical protein
MAVIPGQQDVQRRGLQTSRVDVPGNEDQIIAEAVGNAAAVFTDAVTKHKAKNDSLRYSKAKSEFLSADIRIRRELEDEGDYEQYLENYRDRMNEALDSIMPQLEDPADRELFTADSSLTVERGVSAMQGLKVARHQEAEAASTIDMLDDRRREILSDQMDNATRIDALLTTQEYVRDQVRAGNIPAAAGEKMIKDFVADVSKAQLMTLPLETRAALLEASIAANQDPESEDFKPTGSLADFMHQDERVELLRQTEAQLESEQNTGLAQTAFDRVMTENPYIGAADTFDKRRQAIRDMNLDPEVRALAENLLANQGMAERRSRTDYQDDILKQWAENFRDGKPGPTVDGEENVNARSTYSIAEIPPEQWTRLSAGQQAALKEAEKQSRRGIHYGEVTRVPKHEDEGGIVIGEVPFEEMPSLSLWNRLSPAQKAQVDLDDVTWRMAFTEEDMRVLQNQQETARSTGTPDVKDLSTNYQLVRDALISTGWVPATDRDIEEDKTFARAILELNRLVEREQMSEGLDAKLGYPSYDTRVKLLNDMMSRQAFTDGGWFDRRDPDPDELIPFHKMSDEQKERGWLPLEGGPAGLNARDRQIRTEDGYITAEQYLIQWAKQPVDDPLLPGLGMQAEPDPEDVQRAWFAYFNEMPAEEVLRRLAGD